MPSLSHAKPGCPVLIGIGNKARSGKDTAAEYLTKMFDAKIVRLAGPLYEECRNLKMYLGTELAYNGMIDKDPRLLIWWGEQRRKQHPSYWADMAKDQIISEFDKGCPMVVVPDVRLYVDADMIKCLGGMLVNVSFIGDRVIDRDPTDPTEVELDNYMWDYYVQNVEGNKDILYNHMERVLDLAYGAKRLAGIRR